MEALYKLVVIAGFILLYSVIKGIDTSIKKRRAAAMTQVLKGLQDNAAATTPPVAPPASPARFPKQPSGPALDGDADAVAHLLDIPTEESAAPEANSNLPGSRISARDAVIWGELLRRKF